MRACVCARASARVIQRHNCTANVDYMSVYNCTDIIVIDYMSCTTVQITLTTYHCTDKVDYMSCTTVRITLTTCQCTTVRITLTTCHVQLYGNVDLLAVHTAAGAKPGPVRPETHPSQHLVSSSYYLSSYLSVCLCLVRSLSLSNSACLIRSVCLSVLEIRACQHLVSSSCYPSVLSYFCLSVSLCVRNSGLPIASEFFRPVFLSLALTNRACQRLVRSSSYLSVLSDLCVCLCVCVSVCLSVCLSLALCVSLSETHPSLPPPSEFFM